MFFLQMERRFDYWLRPPFDATLRDPIARLTTAVINMRRKNEDLAIARRYQAARLPPISQCLATVVCVAVSRVCRSSSPCAAVLIFFCQVYTPYGTSRKLEMHRSLAVMRTTRD
jgi:hypothetical protein